MIGEIGSVRPGRTDPISPIVDWNATLPRLEGGQLHLGFGLALLAAGAVWWLLDRSTVGFAIRAVGANPHAAATAGMSVARTTVITMTLAGALAGLAGVQAALGPTASGVPVPLSAGIVGSVGFDAITVALLGRANPAGILFAGLLLGAMRAGSNLMQIQAGVPVQMIDVLQGVILFFLAAEVLVRYIFRVRAARVQVDELQTVSRSYGGQTTP